MTRGAEPEEELERIDEEIERLSARDAGFDFAREVRRVRSALFGDGERTRGSRPGRSKRARVERIKELQRRRERLQEELAGDGSGGNP